MPAKDSRRGLLPRHRSVRSRLQITSGERLEDRLTPAWTGVPPTSISPPAAVAVTLNSQNDATGAAAISTTEIDYYSFVATVSGSYRIAATTPASSLDTVLGVFSSTGARLAYNDDISSANFDSQLSINLTAGTRYFVGITNYTGSRPGSYTWTIDGPAAPVAPTIDLVGAGLSVSNTTAWGQTITASATVRNNGNTASGNFSEQWYLSRDAVGSADDILLSRTAGAGTSLAVASIAGGATSGTLSATLQLPSSLPSGWSGSTFYVVMRTDAGSVVAETNENNNFGQAGNGLDSTPITIGGTVPAGGFQIQLSMAGMTASQRAIFQSAADRWAEVITGDLPNATYNGIVVDDLLIEASAVTIDGVGGVLGQAGPDRFRSSGGLPFHGSMEFDSADIADMESDGSLLDVVVHEIGHILGIGTLWSSRGLVSGTSGSNPIYTGSQALAAYNQIYGTNAAGVPVENTGGSGTRNAHWRESVLGNEVMTGYAGPGTNLPLSRITVGALADLGYQVNYAAADNFSASIARQTLFQSTSVVGGAAITAGSTTSTVGSAGTGWSDEDDDEEFSCGETNTASRHSPWLNQSVVDALMAAYADAIEQDRRRWRVG